MPASIVLNGLSNNFPNPGAYLELDFAQGPVGGNNSARSALILGNKTTAGSATNDTTVYGPDTQTPVQTENDVITLFGAGSQIHRAYLRFTAVNKSTALYMLAVSPSAGAAATLAITITNAATANGTLRLWVGDQFVDTTITSGDAAIAIAGNIAASVNAQSRWAVTAANGGTAICTLTAKNLGPEGNWIRCQSLIIVTGGATIATTTSLTANTFMSGGTTGDVNTTALATILSSKYYGIIPCDSDATNIGRIVTQVNNQAQPTTGIRQRVFFGSMDTLANTITVATGVNAPRAECIWGNCTDLTPLELAANACALYMLLEQGAQRGVNRKNFSLFPASTTDAALWLPQQVGGTNITGAGGRGGVAGAPTVAQVTSALNNGITPITMSTTGQSQLVKRITTKSITGSQQDFRIRDAHRVSVCDYWGDDAIARTQGQFGGKDLLPDQTQGASPIPAVATTPRLWANMLKGLTSEYGDSGQWSYPPGVPVVPGNSPADTINSTAIVQAEVNPPNRMSALFQLSPVNLFDQAAILAQQVG